MAREASTYINNSRYMSLNRDTAEHEIDLVITITEAAEVLDDT